MSRQKESPKYSTYISNFCNMTHTACNEYRWQRDEVNRLDKLTQDYLHMLELDGLDYRQRAKVATQIAKCRRERRLAKDVTEILEPLVQFLESDKGKNMLNLLREVLGKTRKAEARIGGNRIYKYKVYEKEEAESD